jgi:hypothetical protein
MDTINLIIGDSSDIYEFSSKQIGLMDSFWEGSWVISEALGSEPILEGNLIKNDNIYNSDSLEGEEVKEKFKIFEQSDDMELRIDSSVVDGSTYTIQGKIFKTSKDIEGNPIEIPFENTYITVSIKGKFVDYTRSTMVNTNSEGIFTAVFDLSNTIKTPANSLFIFQLMPLQSELLEEKIYFISVEVRQKNDMDEVIFRREVLQAKLKMLKQGVI